MDRLRCAHCRNPLKPHQATSGPAEGDNTFHEDCWVLSQELTIASGLAQQLDYQRRIAAEGLAALLSPYVSTSPKPGAEETSSSEGSAGEVLQADLAAGDHPPVRVDGLHHPHLL